MAGSTCSRRIGEQQVFPPFHLLPSNGPTHYIEETYQQEHYMRAHEIMNLKDHVADLDCIISILNSEGEWELADDLIKISKSFEEVVEKLRSLAANDNYNI